MKGPKLESCGKCPEGPRGIMENDASYIFPLLFYDVEPLWVKSPRSNVFIKYLEITVLSEIVSLLSKHG